ncbi:MAG: HNH endonuclease, partial [Methanomassiliicoccales archaeon]|nr:HNH endonuclease [Methanomassiliicoccales archaeon]
MMGCHFQERPCRSSLCLRPLYLWQMEGLCAPCFFVCDEGSSASCPHRAWRHDVHLQICRLRASVAERCPTCGGRHRYVADCLRCETRRAVEEAFRARPGRPPNDTAIAGRHLPAPMRAGMWRSVRTRVVARDGHRCRSCGKDLSRVPAWLTEVHHIVPRREGGGDHPSNLLTLCVMCHKRATVS